MHPIAERQMLVGVTADVETVRIFECVLVPVGRDVAQKNRLALAIGTPRTSVSAWAVRMNSLTGTTQRIISSTAVPMRDGFC